MLICRKSSPWLSAWLQPFQAVRGCRFAQREILFQVIAAEQDRGRRRAQRAAQFLDRHLVQVLVVDVQLVAIGLQQLLVRLQVGPDELARAGEQEGAGGYRRELWRRWIS
jgi:hypothetical protein